MARLLNPSLAKELGLVPVSGGMEEEVGLATHRNFGRCAAWAAEWPVVATYEDITATEGIQ